MTVHTDKQMLREATYRLYRSGMSPDRIMKIVTDAIGECVIERELKKEVKL